MHWTESKKTRGYVCAAVALVMAALLVAGGARTAAAQTGSPEAAARDWWRNAVILEIYPRSFQDTNGDGVGDLNGITRRLDYLKELGVDAIWLTPVYPSPNVDFGYDISDYQNIDPQYGTLADFDRLVAEAKMRHIRVVMDMVMNHTSDQHKWFLESRSSRENPYRDWYMWRDGKGETATDKGTAPNNWQSDMGHTAWEWDEKTRQYYYHKFYTQQPDLNWDNSKVHEAFREIVRFWLERGVAGFRFDAITTLFEDPGLADEPYVLDKDGKPLIDAYGEKVTDQSKTDNLPGVHAVMQEMRGVFDAASGSAWPGTRVLIGETYVPNIAELAKQYGTAEKPEFHLPMDTQLAFINKLDIQAFRAKLNEVETGIGGNVPLLLFDNHDNPRIDARYLDGVHDAAISRMLATILFASRGASLFYYGDELGMKTTPPTRKEDVKDPMGVTGWPKEKGRDGERTPMQWDATANAGFSKGAPWLPVPPSYASVNAAAEKADKDSLLNWYKELIRLKKAVPALANGSFALLDAENPKALSWVRQAPGAQPVVVTVSFSAEPQTVSLTVPGTGGKLKTLLKSPGGADAESAAKIELGPYGVYVGEVK
ncbi:MAG: alpha-glucosidase [Terracidiphilus sp.]